ncbi:hypothetical protein EUTSA_v10015632mg [Eutrema salsugineum]|uniref:Late embryogenesis abundant protein LEA-2 subgroup domain-containing protein n=1 Tax=Eutrema salsugineum TaxID=72664 RepID=V4KW05_EUTSA|nr:uncharacterized protein LOC18019312 [Eutrema salsugineum]ESQ42175.1 hypothetical protein EUTSA_v10015632mg [Eutrema salsugineum]
MTSQTNTYLTPPSSATPRGWWSRPIVTVPASNDREATFKESAAQATPYCAGFLTFFVPCFILLSIDNVQFHAKISIQSISASSATWQIDFLMQKPSSRYSIYYDVDDTTVNLGPLNAAVLNVTRKRDSRDHTAFSLAFLAEEGNRSDVVSEELDINLRAKHKRYIADNDEAGHFNIRCQNLTRSREKITCQSSFTRLKILFLTYDRTKGFELN